ncbi:hypothetical protein O7628_10505 [Micromonospora sp. WMMD956]|uniref:hypothetical protein n=1 Tax=Micromonospora sp. WMMD956 TaxID=3016108 RepID=UPI002416D058|nr:hypothetical protein [Micromonospora sp. WMMD956]MDG4815934.1 hypothetical protein [Micromonospora sp. WMMD956]
MPLAADVDVACRIKASKCESFLEVADIALGAGYYDVAVSLSASAGINAADLFLLVQQGKYHKGGNHHEALSILRKAGVVGSDMARRLSTVLKNKNRAQYDAANCNEQDAQNAFLHAQRMTDAAQSAYEKAVK